MGNWGSRYQKVGDCVGEDVLKDAVGGAPVVESKGAWHVAGAGVRIEPFDCLLPCLLLVTCVKLLTLSKTIKSSMKSNEQAQQLQRS